MYLCIYINIYFHICIYVCMCVYMYLCMCGYVDYGCVYVWMDVWMAE